MHRRSRANSARRERGQTLVEFALIMPLFALLLFGLLDFGRVVWAQNSVSEAAREASRVGIVEASDSSAKYTKIRNAAITRAPGMGLTSANVTGQGCADCFYPGGATTGGTVVVTVTKQVELLTPIFAQLVGGTYTVSSTARSFIP